MVCVGLVAACGLSLAVVSKGYSLVACGLLTVVASLVAEHRFSSCGAPVACGVFLAQGSNPCPLHWQVDSQPLYHQGSPEHKFFIHSFIDGHGLFSPFGYYNNGAVYSLVHEPFSFNVLNSHSLCLVNESICHINDGNYGKFPWRVTKGLFRKGSMVRKES